jgi:hypothetical protein
MTNVLEDMKISLPHGAGRSTTHRKSFHEDGFHETRHNGNKMKRYYRILATESLCAQECTSEAQCCPKPSRSGISSSITVDDNLPPLV